MDSPLSGLGGGCRPLMVSIVSRKGSATARQVFCELGDKRLSYQGVHKTLKGLVNDGVLRSVGRKYSVDEKWADELNLFSRSLYAPKDANGLPELSEGGVANLKFDSLMELGCFVLDVLYSNYKKSKEPYAGVTHWKHCWPSSLFVGKDYQRLREVMNSPSYCLVAGDTFPDKHFAKDLESMGAHVKCGAHCASECYLLAERDVVTRIYYPSSLNRAVHSLYSSASGWLNLKNHYDLIHLPSSIRVSMVRDPEICRQIIDDTLEVFGTTFEKAAKPPV